MDKIKVIAFDIDGTLYPQYRLHVRMIGLFLRHMKVFYHYGLVRRQLRRTAPLPDLLHYQAMLMSERLGCTTPEAKKILNDVVYNGLAKYFNTIKCFKDVPETFEKFNKAGYRLAILSDFPPEQKGNIWGVTKYCEKLFSTEKIGALKPSKYPFGVMALELKVKPDEILYVGNSMKCDIVGAKNAGMKTAYLEPLWRRILHIHSKEPDFTFRNYKELQEIILR